jgi:nucleoside-diphosphate-sugar epimerase
MALALLELNMQRSLNIHLILLVRNKLKAEKVFQDYLSDDNLEFIVQDVSMPIKYEGEVDYIIHAASQASPKYYGTNPVETANANIIGTYNLLEMARTKSLKGFLFFSSSTIYGTLPSKDVLIDENMYGIVKPLHVRSCYSESKRMAENMCVCYSYQYGVPTKIVRIFHTLGPNMNIDDGRAFSDFCKAIIEGKDIVLHSKGDAQRTFLYVTDAVLGYFIVLLTGNNGEAYNVGSTIQEVSMKQLAEELTHDVYPHLNLEVRYEIDENDVTYSKMKSPVDRLRPSTDKIKSLGWTEKIDYLTAFKRTIDSHLS